MYVNISTNYRIVLNNNVFNQKITKDYRVDSRVTSEITLL